MQPLGLAVFLALPFASPQGCDGVGDAPVQRDHQAQHQLGEKVDDSIWRHPNLIFGAMGIFVYVGAEVSIGSFLVNYFTQPEIGGFTEQVAASFVALYWGGAMVGRFFGSALLSGAKAAYMVLATVGGVLLFLISSWVANTWADKLVAPVGHFGLVAFSWVIVSILVHARPLFGLVAVVVYAAWLVAASL